MRNFVFIVTLLLISAGVFLGVAEIWARWKFGTVCTQPHPIWHHSFIPNRKCVIKGPEFMTKYQINSLGLRNQEIIVPKPENTFRILMVGDSLTQGSGVEQDETFSARLEKLLNNQGRKIEVINGGISANSPLVEYLWIREVGLGLQPDLAILNVNESDFSEEQKYNALRINYADGLVKAVPGKPLNYLPAVIKNWLQKNSSFYLFFNAQIMSRLVAWKASLFSDKAAQSGVKNYPGAIAANGIYAISKGVSDVEYDLFWSPVEKNILLTRDLLTSRRIPFLLIIQPSAHHVSPTAWPSRIRQNLEVGKVYAPPFYNSFINLGKRYGFPVLDLRSIFVTNADQLFYPDDGHWNSKGHAAAAEAISKFVQSKWLN